MKALRLVARFVTGLYILSFVGLVLGAGAWRETAAEFMTDAFLVMLAVGIVVSAIELGCRRSAGRDEP
jgi:hypothetical protein